MFGQQRAGHIHQIHDRFVGGVGPKRRELEAIAGFFALGVCAGTGFFDMADAGRVGIVFGARAIRNDKELYILEQPAGCPEAVALVALDLVESLADRESSNHTTQNDVILVSLR